ncbi:MAG: hypothetical protein D6814_12345 [Calditrichaeota bacterium]|nr:MAG: hypothetical protein D6814_12345 [Calditrichota bacterium]
MHALKHPKFQWASWLLCASLTLAHAFTAAAQAPNYPDSKPQVLETADSLVILFPQQVGIVLQRQPGKF